MAFSIPSQELEIRATRARGPGGQHVNKASTRVEVVWDIARSAVLSDAQRARLLKRLATRIDGQGRMRVASDASRSQRRNLEAAVERLHELVRDALRVPKARKATRPTRSSVERRLDAKRRHARQKRERAHPGDE
jgi:ribosome-associated protein